MNRIKRVAEAVLPRSMYEKVIEWRARRREREKSRNRLKAYKNLTTQEIFTKVYEEGAWGKSDDPEQKFHSGTGSRGQEVVEAYVRAIEKFLRSFDKKPNIVDLGCGDFFVGSRIRELCGDYIACDIVAPLIAHNQEKFNRLNVDFRVLDATQDELPDGEIVFIRQVLQHLSNDKIQKVVGKVASKYKYFVLTEGLPTSKSFTPNRDIPTGPEFRASIDSGIVLTKAPFNLKALEEHRICEIAEEGSLIVTTVYRLGTRE